MGTLNMYSQQPNGFDAEAERVGAILAAKCAAALVRSTFMLDSWLTRDALQRQDDEQTLVARAQGVMMQIQSCNAAQAADLIRNAAYDQGEPLVRTAERILATVRVEDTAPDKLSADPG